MTSTPELTISTVGAGRPALILHGGGGPFTVQAIVDHLSPTMLTITPVHPGWNGTSRPDDFNTVTDIATTYWNYLKEHDLRDVVVIGSSMGGWIGADIAWLDSQKPAADHRVGGLILIDSAGVQVEGIPFVDFFGLTPRQIAEYSFHDADTFFRDPSTLPPEVAAAQGANMATMRVYAGDPYMHDPLLLGRLADIRIPSLVLWGDSDRVFPPEYGQAMATALGDAKFEIVQDAGHLPHIEKPAATFADIDAYLAELAG